MKRAKRRRNRAKKRRATLHLPLTAEQERVVSLIQSAWEDVEHPGDNDIDGCGCGREECQSVVAYFAGRSWEEITFQGLRKHCPSAWDTPFGYMTPAAFQYFLPAFLLMFLRDRKKLDVLASSIVWTLCPHQDWRARVEGFSMEQQEAILEFLLCVVELVGYDDAEGGVSFWRNRLEKDRIFVERA